MSASTPRIDAIETATYIDGAVGMVTTSTADTWVDVPDSDIIVPDGAWELVFEGGLYFSNSSGSAQSWIGNIAICDSDGNIQDGAHAFAQMLGISNGNFCHYIRMTARVTAGTYRLKIRCNSASPVTVSSGNVNTTGSLTGNDWENKWYAKKVGETQSIS